MAHLATRGAAPSRAVACGARASGEKKLPAPAPSAPPSSLGRR